MKTQFKSVNDIKTNIEIGQTLFIDNHVKPVLSRVTTVKTKQSYFFTVLKENKESWIINGAENFKHYGFNFNPDMEKVDIYFKKDNQPYLTLHFNETIIKGKAAV